jgi:glyoxylase-like metal-dependent hydrolase (beta-lactamase superfamily II)
MSSRTGSPAFDRRAFLKLAGAAAALALPDRLSAATPPHDFRHGVFDVTVVSDGHLVLPASVLAPDAPKAELEALLKSAGQGPDQAMPAANIALIRTASDLILVDTGSGPDFQPTAGKLAENLAAAGIETAKVTRVVFTHAHPDHIWGTLNAMKTPRFPNARYTIAAAEWNFWMDPDLIRRMPEAMHGFITGAQRNLGRIKERLDTVKPGDDIVTGLRVLDTAGHTPGHMSLELAGGDGLIVVGDTVPHAAVSFAHPEWRFGFDAIPELAAASRRKLLERAATEKAKLIGYHWPYPGVGFAERKDGAYRFVAAG